MARYVLLTGGGTGGHVYPALAIADALRQKAPGTLLAYAGVRGGIEEGIARRHGIPFLPVVTAPWPGVSRPLPFLGFLARITVGTTLAAWHLLRWRPEVLVATGGFVAAPAVFAAVVLRALRLLRVRVFVHEQNSRPGRLNRLVARFADVTGTSFPGSEDFLPGAVVRHVGYPVRPTIRAATAGAAEEPVGQGAAALAGIPPGRRLVLAFGGSQGARTINRAVVDALPLLQDIPDLFVLHGIGRMQRGGYDPESDTDARLADLRASGRLQRDLDDFYRRVAYIEEMGEAYRRAHLVVCRGGAGTIKEVCAVGRPAVVIPKAGLAGDHQVLNALALKEAGAAVVLLEEPVVEPDGIFPAVTGERLAEAVRWILEDPERRGTMARAARSLDDADALDRILALLSAPTARTEGHRHGGEANRPGRAGPRRRADLCSLGVGALAEMDPGEILERVRDFVASHPSGDLGTLPALDYLRYRAASMLAAPSWEVRNVGVKLVGLLRLQGLVRLLRHLLEDETPAPFLVRLLGGDRVQNGFIRRNIVEAVIRIGCVTPDVEAIVRRALADRYFEVRREAVRAIRSLGSPLSGRPWAVEAVQKLLRDPSFEVRMAAIRAVGDTLSPREGLPLLRPFYTDANWQLRDAVLGTFETWARTGNDAIRSLLRQELDGVLLTAEGYRPVFGLKETARRVAGRLGIPDPRETGEGAEP